MAGDGIAIIAGRGVLPRLLAEDCARRGVPYRVVVLEGVALDWLGRHPAIAAVFEKPGRLFADLRRAGCRIVTLAGGITRPELKPHRFDLTMIRLAPKVLKGIKSGDDATLRLVTEILEAEGLELRAPHDILGDLLALPGVLTHAQPSDADVEDAARAMRIVEALGSVDVGQGAVVAQGICLGLETIQGTDAMLRFVAGTAADLRADPAGARGVLWKAPKQGQDWRVDLPAIGPDTMRAAAAAGLAGIAVRAGGVLVLGRDETIAAADAAGLFLWGHEAAG